MNHIFVKHLHISKTMDLDKSTGLDKVMVITTKGSKFEDFLTRISNSDRNGISKWMTIPADSGYVERKCVKGDLQYEQTIREHFFNGRHYIPVVIRTEPQPMRKFMGPCNPEMVEYNQFVEQYNKQVPCRNYTNLEDNMSINLINMIAKQNYHGKINEITTSLWKPQRHELLKFITSHRNTVEKIMRNIGYTNDESFGELVCIIKGIPYLCSGEDTATLSVSFYPFLLKNNVYTINCCQTTFTYNVISGTLLIEGRERPCDEQYFRVRPGNGQVIAQYDRPIFL